MITFKPTRKELLELISASLRTQMDASKTAIYKERTAIQAARDSREVAWRAAARELITEHVYKTVEHGKLLRKLVAADVLKLNVIVGHSRDDKMTVSFSFQEQYAIKDIQGLAAPPLATAAELTKIKQLESAINQYTRYICPEEVLSTLLQNDAETQKAIDHAAAKVAATMGIKITAILHPGLPAPAAEVPVLDAPAVIKKKRGPYKKQTKG